MPERRFAVVGAQYPEALRWPGNVEHVEHLPPDRHSEFYCSQSYTLNLTRPDMARAGFSPSVRLFEAGACGVPVISDRWPGLETFFDPGKEILFADSSEAVRQAVCELPETQRLEIAARARQRVLQNHTAERRAIQFERYVQEVVTKPAAKVGAEAAA
jgi:spore maturation protein CgeB